jgi:hypothetical protein
VDVVLEAHWADHSTAGTASFQDALAMVRGGAQRPQFAAAFQNWSGWRNRRKEPATGTAGKGSKSANQGPSQVSVLRSRLAALHHHRLSSRAH